MLKCVGVQDIQLKIGNGFTNKAAGRAHIGRVDRSVGHMHSGFGDAVHIHELRPHITMPIKPGLERGKLRSPGDVIVVKVGLHDVRDREVVGAGVGKVDVNVPTGVDHGGDPGGIVADDRADMP